MNGELAICWLSIFLYVLTWRIWNSYPPTYPFEFCKTVTLFLKKSMHILGDYVDTFQIPSRSRLRKASEPLRDKGFWTAPTPDFLRFFRQPPYIHGYFQAFGIPSESLSDLQKVRENTFFQALPLEYRGQNDPGLYFVCMMADSASWGQGNKSAGAMGEWQEK